MLRSKRLIIAGAFAAGSESHAVARRALADGAHVTLVAPPGRFARWCDLAERLPRTAHVVCADLARDEDVAALHEHLRCAYRTVDGALYAAEPGAGRQAPAAFGALVRAVAPLLPPGGGSLVALAEDAEPSAMVAAGRLMAPDLAAAGGRVHVVAAGQDSPGRAADAVCFLLGPLAQEVAGQVLHVDRRTPDRTA